MRVRGDIRVPGDKSISHRALILAAMADGTSRIRGILQSADVAATARALTALGVPIPELGDELLVSGVGPRGFSAPGRHRSLDCGNSGTTTRLLAGVVAAQPFPVRFTGDASLSRRPMQRVARPLERMGARVRLAPHGGLPMVVHGAALHPVDHASDTASAQVKSAILLAGLSAGVAVRVSEPVRSRDHTERMLLARGLPVRVDGTVVTLGATESVPAADVQVPGDPSSAAFLAALAALGGDGTLRIRDVCLNPTRTGFFDVLRDMGAEVSATPGLRDGEVVGDLCVVGGLLRGTRVEAAMVPALIDELPLLACLASRAEGVTEVRGAAELRVKESDRIAAVVDNLRALGAAADELPDGFRVEGGEHPLRGRVRTHGDHRLAMAFGVLAALPGSQIEIDDPACVAVSFPGFWQLLAEVAAP